jgi:hypothetical protein
VPAFSDWFPVAAVGVTFTALGGLKMVGALRGTVGGRDKPLFDRVCGT